MIFTIELAWQSLLIRILVIDLEHPASGLHYVDEISKDL
jgi:hypothetical protein